MRVEAFLNARTSRRNISWVKSIDIKRNVDGEVLVCTHPVDSLLGCVVLDIMLVNDVTFKIVDVANTNVD